ncbi:hypothetical protein [Candidatus Chloroploca sp. Khr17]|uniref:hypothetical protein n=1 Tax=Candidatus Chloroploca sp. Khr17 TaxID=2496869 RepID=UPI00101D20EA|nr:hypothetical protein [Candidatus Chloroploca sp. Khr17]
MLDNMSLAQVIKRPTFWYHVILIMILVLAAVLRLYQNDRPFASSDHAELAAIVTFFYPRSLASLIEAPAPSWQALTSVHGMVPVLIGMVAMTLVGSIGITITEWWWNLPFVLISLMTLYAGAQFAKALGGQRAGIYAALFISVLPIHAVTSRSSGLAHVTLMALSQLLALWAVLIYSENPTRVSMRRASLAVSFALLIDLFFPILLALICAAAGLGVRHTTSFWERLARTRYLLTRPGFLLLPFMIILGNGVLMVASRLGWAFQGGVFSRLFDGSDRQIGIYGGAFWTNAVFVVGVVGLVVLVGLALAALPWLLRLDRRTLPLIWALGYLVPFVLFTRANITAYLVMGMVALSLNAALIVADLGARRSSWQAWGALGLVAVLTIFLGLRTLTIIFPLNFGSVIGAGQAQGGVFPDTGLKAAGWWLRMHTSSDDLVFGDARFEPYELWYYVRRPSLALTDAQRPEEPYARLKTAAQQPRIFLVPPDRVPLLFAYVEHAPSLLLVITDQEKPILHIYGYQPMPVAYLDVAQGNRWFDQAFGHAAAMFSLATTP